MPKFAPSNDFKLSSPAFENGAQIPRKHTGEGEDVMPALNWTGAPEGTKSFAVHCTDPDAPLVWDGKLGFEHMMAYNIAGDATGPAEGQTAGVTFAPNSYATIGAKSVEEASGYNGPMPPPGHNAHYDGHNYFFFVLALDCVTDAPAGTSWTAFLEKFEQNVIGVAQLRGQYVRK